MSRVLVIGLDSADAELIDKWCANGHLPTLAALRRDGLWSRLSTTAEVMHVSAWPTLYTGVHPGRHGVYHAYQVRAGDQRIQRTRPEWLAAPPFWKYLDDAGRRCIVMDAFMDHSLEDFRGVQILEYGTWTWFTRPGGRPRHTRRELLRRFGPYPAPEHTQVPGWPDPAWFRERLIAGALLKGRAVRWLLRTQPWDMAFVTFAEPHGAGHYLWHVEDPTYPAHASGLPSEPEHPLRDVYGAVDAALRTVLEAVDDSTTVIVTSGDGMGPNFAGCHLVPELLHRLGLFHSTNVGDASEKRGSSRRKGLASRLRERIPLSFRQAVSRCLPRELHYRMQMKWVNAGVDWTRSKVFCIPNANEAYLRLNLQGREPQGTVDRDGEPAQLLGLLCERMAEVINPTTGHRAAHGVYRTDLVFPGEQRQHLPDLVVTWDAEARVLDQLHCDATGRIQGVPPYRTSPYYTGNHRPNAFVAARGPRIRAGAALPDGHVADLAPTLLALLDVDPPIRFDGRPWPEVAGG